MHKSIKTKRIIVRACTNMTQFKLRNKARFTVRGIFFISILLIILMTITPAQAIFMSGTQYFRQVTLNKDGITYKRYFEDPQIMLDIQCRFQDFIRHNIVHDIEMGIPQDGWTVLIDFQNVFEFGQA